ncbi:MAG: hypothetical protein U1F60_15035 [Planctomycetota bacterium]
MNAAILLLSASLTLAPIAANPASSLDAAPGRVGGPGEITTRVEAHDTDQYEIRFHGEELAQIIVRGDGDTDLDLYVYDENDNLIASDTDSTDVCVVRWTPRWTGNFRVRVKNLGRVYNRYTLTTN